MNVVKGTVEAVNVKEPKEGKFGKYAAFGVKIGEDWHNGLCNEKNGEVWPWFGDHKVEKGQQVEMLIEKNNKGYDSINTKQSKVVSGSAPNPAPSPAQQPPQPSTSTKPDSQSFKAALWVNCLDSAISAAKLSGKEKIVTEDIIRAADIFYKKALDK